MSEAQTEKHEFQAEVGRLLDIVVHAFYSQKEIFLRELISNAADACDKLRYTAVTQPDLAPAKFAIHLVADIPNRTLTVSDNGIGMTRNEIVENLGTIARSGTKAFLEQMSGDAKKDMNLIGQFGVGFYSAFMVADKVEVISRKAGETEAWRWTSDGKSAYTMQPATKNIAGTDIILHLKDDESEFMELDRLKAIVTAYSDHIAVPIYFGDDEAEKLNRAAALWMRSKNEITPDEYKEFYHHVAHAYDEPAQTIHWRAEGTLEYTGLLFIPTQKPHDLFDPRRFHRVKLYVKRVFITEAAEGLLPPYLRFLKGVIDSEDLPLNVSREMLQNNPVLTKMRNGITKRVLSELSKLSENKEEYTKFWNNFGAVLKEGLYDDYDHREDLLKLFRAYTTKTTAQDKQLVTLEEYIARMPAEQDAIYYITGEDAASLANSPQLEGFRARDIEVLLLSDAIDDFWVTNMGTYNGKVFKSATRGDMNLDKIKKVETPEENKPTSDSITALIKSLKEIYGDSVKDVRTSSRLTSSPVCIVAADGELDIHLEKLLRQNKAAGLPSGGLTARRFLEINPTHSLIVKMAQMAGNANSEEMADLAWLLLDQARLLEGEPLADPQAFSQRLTRLSLKAVA
ncbi:MAG: molecular chaperone HtpG [Alphaproteobacteria bacterium]|nr:molecular chaperone HtpG [Alphaproteobacteria bacterium]